MTRRSAHNPSEGCSILERPCSAMFFSRTFELHTHFLRACGEFKQPRQESSRWLVRLETEQEDNEILVSAANLLPVWPKVWQGVIRMCLFSGNPLWSGFKGELRGQPPFWGGLLKQRNPFVKSEKPKHSEGAFLIPFPSAGNQRVCCVAILWSW